MIYANRKVVESVHENMWDYETFTKRYPQYDLDPPSFFALCGLIQGGMIVSRDIGETDIYRSYQKVCDMKRPTPNCCGGGNVK